MRREEGCGRRAVGGIEGGAEGIALTRLSVNLSERSLLCDEAGMEKWLASAFERRILIRRRGC